MEENLFKEMFDNLPSDPGLPDETKFPRIIPTKNPQSIKMIGENLNTYYSGHKESNNLHRDIVIL